MSDLLDKIPEESRSEARKKQQPYWSGPMLATLTKKRFSDPDWIFERKLDGERCLVFKNGGNVRLMSRNKKQLNDTYPELVEAISKQEHSFIADGEIVAFKNGKTSFSKLQKRMHSTDEESKKKVKVYYYLFDMLHINEYDITGVPLRDRKKILSSAISFSLDHLVFCSHINEKGEEYYNEACSKGWEGIIAKDARAKYVHSRSRKWLKFKCVNRQEMVIGGFTDPRGSRKGFGALLIGYYENKKLQYAGKVGTGYTDEFLEKLRAKMDRLETDENPFEQKEIGGENIHWVRPRLVGAFRFTEWTRENRLRHPSFVGLRDDKDAKEVIREKPV